ncbi:hypothetical protein LEP1GSC047_4382 [Leptospira inadai serovar Lyme str. 10]|uniref:1-aminocyclopropane-1-carboxylate deaminase n=2 Tax=Leptospira inadai serovar Lyme TaxID=293084 RepID=V6HDA4_9LEPT|nr:1-aminocyclopropane-1-carboxylate deaminase [Leptospira inadai]EQA37802.1 hypothetical protein LEP1GSC047_4382 [Leptospira inadai serovar Lyme str. 10]PNV72781.1 1-aminocyclopropane-1-carboxylate deaminase [Leptospira inadai serovar Lyme]
MFPKLPARFYGASPVQFLYKINKSEIFVKREDRLFFSQGTKIRKLLGIYRTLAPYFRSGKFQTVVLQGNLHSNAILAGILFFRWLGIPTKVIGYSRNLQLQSPASILAGRFSEIVIYPTRREWEHHMQELLGDTGGGIAIQFDRIDGGVEVPTSARQILLPEYLFCQNALDGLAPLWDEIDPNEFDGIMLDVGSGITWLSALEWNRLPVFGVTLGLPKRKMQVWLESRRASLHLKHLAIPYDSLIEPKAELPLVSFSFGETERWNDKANQLWKKTGIYFEPVYACKTLSVLESMVLAGKIEGRILYVYQGGILQNFSIDVLSM